MRISYSLTQKKNTWLTSHSILPSDPYYLQVPGTTQTLKFHNYGQVIDDLTTVALLQQASDDALQTHQRADTPMGEHDYVYRDGMGYRYALQLVLKPGSVMTWDLWYEAIGGIAEFVSAFEYRELRFDVLIGGKTGYAVVGNGRLNLLSF